MEIDSKRYLKHREKSVVFSSIVRQKNTRHIIAMEERKRTEAIRAKEQKEEEKEIVTKEFEVNDSKEQKTQDDGDNSITNAVKTLR